MQFVPVHKGDTLHSACMGLAVDCCSLRPLLFCKTTLSGHRERVDYCEVGCSPLCIIYMYFESEIHNFIIQHRAIATSGDTSYTPSVFHDHCHTHKWRLYTIGYV